jgi:hypothetical protein
MNSVTRSRWLVLLGLITAVWAFTTVPAPADDEDNPGILPVDSEPHGLSYGEWSARWNQWAFSMPIDKHPLFDTADVSEGQSGSVWFIGGTFIANPVSPGVVMGVADRTCTIPAGKALFFPIIADETSTLEGNGTTPDELAAVAANIQDHAADMECTIDGAAVNDIGSYRVQSPSYTYGPLPDNNLVQFFGFDAPAGSTSLSASDGVFLMLAPMSAGKHTIHFSGAIIFTEAADGFDFTFLLDVTYRITVVARK